MATFDVQPLANAPSQDQSASTWLEAVPIGYRRLRAGIAATIAVALAGWLAWAQWEQGKLGHAESLWVAVILAAGMWRSRYWMKHVSVRRFATYAAPLSMMERLRKAYGYWLLGFGGAAFIWLNQYHSDDFLRLWPLGLPFVVIGLVGAFIFAYGRTENRLTSDAAQIKEELEARATQDVQSSPSWADAFLERIATALDMPLVRYPLATLALWFAYYVNQEWTGRGSWMVVLAAVCGSLWLARELFGWILGIAVVGGIGWALFAGVAALPVSAAIVIGALIIASAMKK